MDPRFMIDRNGKSFCLYAGLLDEAHRQGLVGIGVDIIQAPDPDNGQVAICRATVTMQQRDEDGERSKVYVEIADASPANVTRAMQTCLLRMAATRAKARALRDAVNIGVTALEEMGDEDAAPARPAHPQSAPAAPAARPTGKPDAQKQETIPQVLARESQELRALLVKWEWATKDIASEFSRMVHGPSAAQKLDQLREWRAQLVEPANEPDGWDK